MNHCSYCNGKMECEGIEDFDIDEIRRQAIEEALALVSKYRHMLTNPVSEIIEKLEEMKGQWSK